MSWPNASSASRATAPRTPPARATLGVYRMPTDTPVEMNAVAVRDQAVALGGAILVVVGLIGWRWAFGMLAIGPALGGVAMGRLRALPEAAAMAGGRR